MTSAPASRRVLDLALVGVGDAHARHRLGVRARAPQARGRFPVALVVLHLGPDEVVAGVGHRAVGRGVAGAEERAAGHLAALHHLQLHRIPDLRAGRRVERRPVLPARRVERPLVDRAHRRDHPRVAVLAGRGGERKGLRAGCRAVGVRIGTRAAAPRALPGRCGLALRRMPRLAPARSARARRTPSSRRPSPPLRRERVVSCHSPVRDYVPALPPGASPAPRFLPGNPAATMRAVPALRTAVANRLARAARADAAGGRAGAGVGCRRGRPAAQCHPVRARWAARRDGVDGNGAGARLAGARGRHVPQLALGLSRR